MITDMFQTKYRVVIERVNLNGHVQFEGKTVTTKCSAPTGFFNLEVHLT